MKKKSLQEIIDKIRKDRGIVRYGKCKRCGKCCEGPVKQYSLDEVNLTIKRIEDSQSRFKCFKYNQETKLCTAYKDDKPEVCKLFPFFPENRFEGCGFKFKKIEVKK